MTTQLLIYERAVPISKQRHHDWSVKVGKNYTFARRVNSVPLVAAEFYAAAAEYAIVFAGTEKAVMPSVILGIRERENLYVSDTGKWITRYIPAFIRRYPFVFSSNDDGKTFTVCIDEEYMGCNQQGLGERLFDTENEQTQYLGNVLEFLKAYQIQFQRTQAFCNKLKELELLEPMQAQFEPKTGGKVSLSGFMAVSRARIKKLPGDKLAKLAKLDELELIYLHLQSMRNVSLIAERVAPRIPDENKSMLEETEKVGNRVTH
uniref:SapC protein n=1 Tax=Candidatus Kentrum eta TaxID=2126337 RepID=A0A450VJ53_9GAMM|nr:MAG: SapC protein [Candidatus Kentron sp. H]VFK04761.1 MAG: SapC protein [Candidatus Kentron sp. H]VFK08358.1 MAG: SapC protein [Candidatus Kentron sp. H]